MKRTQKKKIEKAESGAGPVTTQRRLNVNRGTCKVGTVIFVKIVSAFSHLCHYSGLGIEQNLSLLLIVNK